ncbi:hypothetical protein [Polyangium spumosum]|uniref:Uncharacterized protein n=1 Tax=Polyangium spumosum TaxID=889282 RepID=A0A6N7Q0E1_9BACT|nr:hypothetical protein [Polyangium spumosum]MRG96190.1 hypothetical protein [Polyangium spumosum]
MKARQWARILACVAGAVCLGAASEARAEEAEDVDIEEESAALDEAADALVAQGICEVCRRTCARGRCLPICARIRCAAPDWLRRDVVDPPPWRWRDRWPRTLPR